MEYCLSLLICWRLCYYKGHVRKWRNNSGLGSCCFILSQGVTLIQSHWILRKLHIQCTRSLQNKRGEGLVTLAEQTILQNILKRMLCGRYERWARWWKSACNSVVDFFHCWRYFNCALKVRRFSRRRFKWSNESIYYGVRKEYGECYSGKTLPELVSSL